MTYPPGTRVRVTGLDLVVDEDGDALLPWPDGEAVYSVVILSHYLAANPDKVTVLLDEPADGSVVLDKHKVAWQREDGGWCPVGSRNVYTWESVTDEVGPLTVIHAGGSE